MKWRIRVLAVAMATTAPALASEWTGNESDDWFDPANWTAGVPTTSTNQVRISTTNPNSARIDGAQASTGTLFGVGHNGTGELTLANGATLVSGSASLGSQSAGDGSVTISGAGSSWQVSGGNFDIGISGTGQVDLLDGGQLLTSSLRSRIGQQASGIGEVLVSGAGSVWELQSEFWLGTAGSGRMTISNGGEVLFSGATSTLGQAGNASGELLITGAGSRMSGTRLNVGNGSTSGTTLASGLLQLIDGGSLELSGSGPPANYRLIIASNARSEGTVVVGAPSGETPLAPGALLLAGGISFNGGQGSLVFNHDGVLEMDFPVVGPINGSAHVQAENGTTLFVDQPFDYSGSLTIEEIAVFGARGRLGNVVNEGRLVASPGQSATLVIDGDYSHGDNAVLEVQFAPGPVLDRVEVSGEVAFSGGTIDVRVLPGHYGNMPLDGIYPVLTASGGISGALPQIEAASSNAFALFREDDTLYLEVFDQMMRDRFEE